MMTRPMRWLVIAYFTGVDGMAGSLHVDRIIEELSRRGHEVLLVTGPVSSHRGARVIRVGSLSPAGIRFELRHRFKAAKAARTVRVLKPLAMAALFPFYAIEKALLSLEPTWSWVFTALIAAARAAKGFAPDVLLSTCGPYSAHFAAAAVARRFGVPWIAEYRDPVRFKGSARGPIEDRLFDRLERTVAREASAVVYLTEAARAAAVARFAPRGRAVTLYSGAPLPEKGGDAWTKGPHLDLVHLGTLAKTRTLDPFREPLSLLREERPDAYRDVRIVQYGHTDARVKAQAVSTGGKVEIVGRVANREVDGLMRTADVLLLIQDKMDISSQSIPGKTYEYLQSGRPVLGLVHRNPELIGMLRSLGHWAVELEDARGVAEAIAQIHGLWAAGMLPSAAKSPYTVTAFVDGLLGLTGANAKGPFAGARVRGEP